MWGTELNYLQSVHESTWTKWNDLWISDSFDWYICSLKSVCLPYKANAWLVLNIVHESCGLLVWVNDDGIYIFHRLLLQQYKPLIMMMIVFPNTVPTSPFSVLYSFKVMFLNCIGIRIWESELPTYIDSIFVHHRHRDYLSPPVLFLT